MLLTNSPKRYVCILLICIISFFSNAQSEECGFRYTPEAEAYFNSVKQKIKSLETQFLEQRLSSSSTLLTAVPIKAHIIRRTDGTGGLIGNEKDCVFDRCIWADVRALRQHRDGCDMPVDDIMLGGDRDSVPGG